MCKVVIKVSYEWSFVLKKRIAIIESGFINFYIENLVSLCRKNGVSIDLITNKKDSEYKELFDKTFFIFENFSHKNFRRRKELEDKIKSIIDISAYDYIFADGLGLSFCCTVFHNPTLAFTLKSYKNFFYKKIIQIGHIRRLFNERFYYKNSPKIFVVSNILADDYEKHCKIDKDKITIVYPGSQIAKDEDTRPFSKISDDEFFIIGQSSTGLVPKGGYIFLKALRIFRKKYPRIRFRARMIYPKYKKFSLLYFYLKLFRLENFVEVLPYQKAMKDFYNSLNCFCCVSQYEAFGRVVTEAMSYKLPVILTSNIGAVDVVMDNETAFVCLANKKVEENIADKLASVYKNYNNLEQFGEIARESVKKYTWEKMAKDIFYTLYNVSF